MPSYGFAVQLAVADLIEKVPQLGTLGKQLHLRNVGTFALSTDVLARVSKVRTLLGVAEREYPDTKAQEAHTKLKGFLDACDKLHPGQIQSLEGWFAWVEKQGVAEGWVTRMEFAVLLQNFGYTNEQAESLRAKTVQIGWGRNGVPEEKTLEEYSFRWLSKLLGAYQLKGCLADLVNLAYAMTTRTAPAEKPTEKMFVGTINTLSEALQNRDLKHLTWIPTHLQIDGEFDDALCWMVLVRRPALLRRTHRADCSRACASVVHTLCATRVHVAPLRVGIGTAAHPRHSRERQPARDATASSRPQV